MEMVVDWLNPVFFQQQNLLFIFCPDGRTQTNIIKESALHQSGLLPLYNMSNTRTSISSDIQTQRSELKNEAEPSFSQPTSRCLMNTL